MPDSEFERLLYRGHVGAAADVDFSASLLSASYPGGYREDVIINSPNGLRYWKLTYPNNNERAFVPIPNGEPVSRSQYIWDFYSRSKAAGNKPFVMTCPLDGKDYLCIFTQNRLSYTLVDWYMRTTGLDVEQVFVKGVNTLPDGSLGDGTNPDEI